MCDARSRVNRKTRRLHRALLATLHSNIFGSNNPSPNAPGMLNAGMLALPLKSTEAKKVDWAAALGRYVARAYSKEHAAAHSEQFATVAT